MADASSERSASSRSVRIASRTASLQSASTAGSKKSRFYGRRSLKFSLSDVPRVGILRMWSFGLSATTEPSEEAKHARDFSRNVEKRKTHVLVRTCFPTRFRPMKEKEYELKVKQKKAAKILEKEKQESYKKKDRFKSFAAQRASVRRFLNDAGFRHSITGTFLDNSDAFRRKRDEMEEAEPEPPSEEELAEEKKVNEDNAWIVKTLEENDTREELEQRVIQHIMQDPPLFTTLRNTLRVTEGNRRRHRKSLHKKFYDMEEVCSTAELVKQTELALVRSDMRGRLHRLHRELRAAQSNRIPRFSYVARDPTSANMCYWESEDRYKKSSALEKELLSDVTVNRFSPNSRA